MFKKQITFVEIAFVPFFIISLILFCNLNGILSTLIGLDALGSPVILLCCISVVVLVPVTAKLFNVFIISFIIYLISFVIIGLLSGFLNFNDPLVRISGFISGGREILTALIILLALYVYSRHKFLIDKGDDLLVQVLFFFILTLLVGIFEGVLGFRELLYTEADPNRALGFFGNPNETGLQANLTFILGSYLFFKRKIGILAVLTITFLCFYGAVTSFSKSAIIINIFLLVCFVIKSIHSLFYVSNSHKRNLLKLLFTFCFLLILGIKLFVIPYVNKLEPSQIQRLESILTLVFKGEFNNETTSGRSEIFNDAILKIKNKPLFGYGLNTFTAPGMFRHSPGHGVHNLYLKFAGEGGIFIFIFFIFLLVFYFLSGLFLMSDYRGYLLCMFIIAFSLFAFGSHNVLGKKFLIGLFAIVLGQLSFTKKIQL